LSLPTSPITLLPPPSTGCVLVCEWVRVSLRSHSTRHLPCCQTRQSTCLRTCSVGTLLSPSLFVPPALCTLGTPLFSIDQPMPKLSQPECHLLLVTGYRDGLTRLAILVDLRLPYCLHRYASAFIDTPVPSLPVMCRFASSMLMPLLRPYQSISLSWFRHRRPPTPSEKILIRQLTPAIDAAAVSLRPSRLNRRTRYIRTLSNTIRP